MFDFISRVVCKTPVSMAAGFALLAVMAVAGCDAAYAGCGGSLGINDHCGQQVQQFSVPVYQQQVVQQVVVPHRQQIVVRQQFVQPQRVIVQRQVVGHHQQQVIVVQQVQKQQRQVVRQRIVTRSR